MGVEKERKEEIKRRLEVAEKKANRMGRKRMAIKRKRPHHVSFVGALDVLHVKRDGELCSRTASALDTHSDMHLIS